MWYVGGGDEHRSQIPPYGTGKFIFDRPVTSAYVNWGGDGEGDVDSDGDVDDDGEVDGSVGGGGVGGGGNGGGGGGWAGVGGLHTAMG